MFLSLLIEALVLCVFIKYQVATGADLSNTASPNIRDSSYTTLYRLSPNSPLRISITDCALLSVSKRQDTTSQSVPHHFTDLSPTPKTVLLGVSSRNSNPLDKKQFRTSVLLSPLDMRHTVSHGKTSWVTSDLEVLPPQLTSSSERIKSIVTLIFIANYLDGKDKKKQRIMHDAVL